MGRTATRDTIKQPIIHRRYKYVSITPSLLPVNGILNGRRRDPDERATTPFCLPIPFAIPFKPHRIRLLGPLLSALLKLRLRAGKTTRGAVPKTDLKEMLVVYRNRLCDCPGSGDRDRRSVGLEGEQ
jgi:hypothetical protein